MMKWFTEEIGCFSGPVTVGIIRRGKGYYIVDSGIDNSLINKITKIIGQPPIGALVTHHHTDHMGGLSKLQNMGINDIYVPEQEIPFFENPLLQPIMLSGYFPPKILQNKHLMARPIKAPKRAQTLPQDIASTIETPGHSIGHRCYLADNVLFAGDAIFHQSVIDKHRILFATNPRQAHDSALKLLNSRFDSLVLGHGQPIIEKEEARILIHQTAQHYQLIQQLILENISENGTSPEDLIRKVSHELGLQQDSVVQMILTRHTIWGHIANLIDLDAIILGIEGKLYHT